MVDDTRQTLMGPGDHLRRGALVVMRSDEDVHAYADGTEIYYEDIVGEGVDFTTQQLVAYDWHDEYTVQGRWIEAFRWVDSGAAMTAVIKVDDPCVQAEDVLDWVQVWVTPIVDVKDSCLEGSECVAD